MSIRKLKLAGLFIALLLAAACGGGSSGSTGKVYGQIIGFTTRAGIEGASIKLYDRGWGADDTVKTATTNAGGFFTVENVDPGDHLLQVEATGYATHRAWITLQDGESVAAVGFQGQVALQLGCDIIVYAMDNGTPVQGATVFADGTATDPLGAGNVPTNQYEIFATTDADGKATLSGLGQESVYNLVAPALDSDGDGTYNYTTTVTWFFACTDNDTTHTMELTRAGRDDAILVVGGNYQTYDTPNSGAYDITIGPNDPLIFVFSYPINPGTGAESWTSDDILGGYATPAAVNFTPALSAGNTVLTLTPAAALTENESYTLRGSVEALINGQPNQTSFAGLNLDAIYVFRDADTVLTEVVARSVGGTLNLEFPEPVNGAATVKSTTTGGVTTVIQNAEINIGGAGAPVVQGGVVVWRVDTFIALAAADTAVVYIDGDDMDGTVIQGEVNLTLQ